MLVACVGAASAAQSRAAGSPPPGPNTPDAAALEQRLADAARAQPKNVEAHHALAAFYLRQNRIEAAIPHLERAQKIDPAHYASGYDLALALIEAGRLEDARTQVRRLLAQRERGELHNLLGDLEERAGNLTAAADEYQRAAHMDASEEHLFDWGNNLVQLGVHDAARQVFTAAVARHPKSARLQVGLGIAHYSRGEYPEAVKAFCTASDLAPSDPRPHQFLGEMYGVAPDLAGEVTKRLARFVKAQPRNALGHYHYAMSLWKGERTGEPVDPKRIEVLLTRAAQLDPTLAKAHLELGILLSEQQRFAEAIKALVRATELEPDFAQAHYRLAQAYQRTGQKELAAREFGLFERLKGR